MYIGVEGGVGNLILELGIVGLVLWVVLGLAISFSTWKAVKELRGTPWFPLSFVIFFFSFLLFFPMTYVGTTYQDFLVNAYLWLLLGMLYRQRMLSRAAQILHQQAIRKQG
jgi:O-antigen ligase